jgi:hypothetical protein
MCQRAGHDSNLASAEKPVDRLVADVADCHDILQFLGAFGPVVPVMQRRDLAQPAILALATATDTGLVLEIVPVGISGSPH